MDFMMKMDFLMKNGGGMHGSILDRLSTGNLGVDTVLAAVIPIAMRYFLPARSYKPVTGHVALDAIFLAVAPLLRAKRRHIQARLRAGGASVLYGMRNTYETTIRFQKESKNLVYGGEETSEDSEEGKRNNILQKAILLYIGHLDLEYRRSQALLTAIKQKPSSNGHNQSGMDRYGRPKQAKVFGGTAEQLKSFSISIAPPEDVWVQVDKESAVWFKQSKAVHSGGGGRDGGGPDRETITTIEYAFWCARFRGNALIKAFIKEAYDWYAEEMKSTEDHARYMYSLIAQPEPPRMGLPMSVAGVDYSGMGGDPRGKKTGLDGSPLRYRRYKLGDGKDFDSLFFPEKESLLKTLGNFEAKRGKYAIKGYPHKLGLLLYGPPGTGKTSLIKALACQTGRHIIQVPLGRVNTNQDLMNIMLDESFPVAKQDLPISLKHENVIFVFEDVDTASKIVKARSGWNSNNNNNNTRTLPKASASDSIGNFFRPPKGGASAAGRSGRDKMSNCRGRDKTGQKKGGKDKGEGGGEGSPERNKSTTRRPALFPSPSAREEEAPVAVAAGLAAAATGKAAWVAGGVAAE